MDKLILLGTAKGGLAGLKKRGACIDARSHLALLAPVAASAGFRIRERCGADFTAARREGPSRDLRTFLSSPADCDPETVLEIERRLGFVYPYEQAAAMKSKYAVTELARLSAIQAGSPDAGLRAEPAFAAAAPRFLSGRRAPDAAERGSLVHRALEVLDFRAARDGLSLPGYLENALNALVERGVFTRDEAEAADVGRLRNFLESDICRRAVLSPELHKETPFVIRKESDGEEVLVQGIIDCWFVEKDALVLLDYKSGHAATGAGGPRGEVLRRVAARYRPQLAAYAEALESIRGARVSEAYLFLLAEGECLRVELS
jgi:ATP-dependent helicase/nuclease subunit A